MSLDWIEKHIDMILEKHFKYLIEILELQVQIMSIDGISPSNPI